MRLGGYATGPTCSCATASGRGGSVSRAAIYQDQFVSEAASYDFPDRCYSVCPLSVRSLKSEATRNGARGEEPQSGKMERLTERELAARWRVSVRTLQNWRWIGRGPRFLKIGARVLYPIAEIEAFEAAQVHQSTVGPIAAV